MLHFIECEVNIICESSLEDHYGRLALVEKDDQYYITKGHWREGLIAQEVSDRFAREFIKEFKNDK